MGSGDIIWVILGNSKVVVAGVFSLVNSQDLGPP
jgi:hypothetical protein